MCRALSEHAAEPLLIPSPVLVEVDYWIGHYTRVRELCDRYADADIGFVEAAVFALVERLNEPKLATLDLRHFSVLRPRHRDSLELLPA